MAPKQFTTSLITPIPKKGDLTQMTNYRGISLMSHAAKLYNRIILNRISEPIDTVLRPNQAGFRKGRSCIDQIHIIRTILAAAVDKQLPLYITYVDFKKAFDSINREKMFQILRHYGIPEKIVQSIKVIYNNSRSSVIVEGRSSKEFDVTTGVLQGDTLAPLLFVIVIDYVMKNAVQDSATERDEHGFLTNEREGSKTWTKFSKPPTYIYDLDFADDIALLENSRDSCLAQLLTVSKRAGQVGLAINDKKTVVMFNQPKQRNRQPNTQITLNGHEIQTVKSRAN